MDIHPLKSNNEWIGLTLYSTNGLDSFFQKKEINSEF